MPTIKVNGVSGGQGLHESPQVAGWGFNHQVEMVGHKRHKIEPDFELLHTLPQSAEEPQPVRIVFEE